MAQHAARDADSPRKASPEAVRARLGQGAPLEPQLRTGMERGFGQGLESVRVHADSGAAALAQDVGALAFAVGDDIAFAAGAYRPATLPGQALIAHEVAHTLQQRAGGAPASASALEADATAGATTLVTGGGWSPLGAGGLRLQRCNGDSHPPDPDRPPAKLEAPQRYDPAARWGGVERPGAEPTQGFLEKRLFVDGDGDQAPELKVGISGERSPPPDLRVRRVSLDVEMLDGRAPRQDHAFNVPTGFDLVPAPAQITLTDGHDPTLIWMLEPNAAGQRHQFRLYPPPREAGDTAYRAELSLNSWAGKTNVQEHTYRFPGPPVAPRTVFAAGEGRPLGPGLWVLDVAVGAYGDTFRLTLTKTDPLAGEMVLAFSGVNGDFVGPTIELRVKGVTGPPRLALVRTAGPALELDLNGDGKTDVTLFDRLQGVTEWIPGPAGAPIRWSTPSRNRDHRISGYDRDGKAVGSGEFQVRDGRLVTSGSLGYEHHFAAIAQADAAARLGQQALTATLDEYITTMEQARAQVRASAMKDPDFPAKFAPAWDRLTTALVRAAANVQPPRPPNTPPQTLEAQRKEVATAAHELLDLLEPLARPMLQTTGSRAGGRVWNTITGSSSGSGSYKVMNRPPYLTALEQAALRGDWATAVREHRLAAEGIDRLLVTRLEAKGRRLAAQQLSNALAMSPHLAELAASHAVPVASVFYPREPGTPVLTNPPSFPVPLFYWREPTEWKLRCLLDPSDPFTLDEKAGAETVPPHTLFAQLGQKNRLPEGHLIYQVPGPGGRTSTVESVGEWTPKRIASAIATGAAVVGFIALTGGAGSIAVTTIFAVSGVAAATSAVLDIVDQVRDESLTPRELFVDAVTIAGSLLGSASAISIEVRAAQQTIQAGQAASRVQQAIAQLPLGNLAKPLTIAATVADLTQFAIYTDEVVSGLKEIEKNVPPGERARAAALLLAQFATIGSLTILGVRGNVATVKGISGKMFLEFVNGVPVIRVSVGSVAADEYRKALAKVGVPDEVLKNVDVITAKNAQELAAVTGNPSGTASFIVRKGRAQLHVVEGAPPESVLHEAGHFHQWADPKLRPLLARLDEVAVGQWAKVPTAKRVDLHSVRLQVEIDVQKRTIAELERKVTAGVPQEERTAVFAELDEAWRALEQHRAELTELAGYMARVKQGAAAPAPEFLADPARLFHQPPGASGAIDEHWLTLQKHEFVAEYQARYPDSALSKAELEKRFELGQRLHPETGRLRHPDEDLGARATFRGDEERLRTSAPSVGPTLDLEPAQASRRDELLKQRDAARQRRRDLEKKVPPDETALAAAHYGVVEASRQLGELHAEAWVRTSKYAKGAEKIERIYGGEASRSGDFDQVWAIWRKGAQDEWVVQLVVIEAKGGSSGLGARRALQGGAVILAEQGSRAYFDSIVQNMVTKGTPKMQDTAKKIAAAPADKVHYVLVKVPIEGETTSTVSTVVVREFDI
jgi:hypothetical protein